MTDTDVATSSTGLDTGTETGECGDGLVDPDEECDDGEESVRCTVDCTISSCGDGYVNVAAGEECDDGEESAACDVDCTNVECGDALVNMSAGEECDDMGESMSCNVNCTISMCGDGVINTAADEECDDIGRSATCDVDCTLAICGDGEVNVMADEECDDGNMVDDDGCGVDCQDDTRLIFVTSQLFTGDLGGLLGADAQCQALAAAAGLPGTYMAWLSTDTESPSTRMTQSNGSYVRPDGVQIAPSWAGLIDGDLDNPINVTEMGSPAPIGNTSCGGGGFPTVWAATDPSGTYSGFQNCMNWTSTMGGAAWGYADATSGEWTQWCWSETGGCAWQSPLYCVEQ